MELYSYALLVILTILFVNISLFFKTNWAVGFRLLAAGLIVVCSIIGLYGIDYATTTTIATNYTLQQLNTSTYTLNTSDNTTYYLSGYASNWFTNASSQTRALTLTTINSAWTQYFFSTTLLGGLLFALAAAWRAYATRKTD